MTNSPSIKYELASSEEMEALYREHNVQQKLDGLSSETIYEPQSLMHEAFCCKKNTIIYYADDAGTKVEVAEICEQQLPSGRTRKIVTKLRIGNVVKLLRV